MKTPHGCLTGSKWCTGTILCPWHHHPRPRSHSFAVHSVGHHSARVDRIQVSSAIRPLYSYETLFIETNSRLSPHLHSRTRFLCHRHGSHHALGPHCVVGDPTPTSSRSARRIISQQRSCVLRSPKIIRRILKSALQ